MVGVGVIVRRKGICEGVIFKFFICEVNFNFLFLELGIVDVILGV